MQASVGSTDKRFRVLVIAEAANPEWVSVPLIGWSLSQALRSVADVHLVTQVRNRNALIKAGLVEGVDFTALDTEAVSAPLWKLGEILRMGEGKGWTTLQAIAALSYPYFEHMMWKTFGARLKAGEFDVVHRITPLTPTIGSPIARKCAALGIPFVLGPLNGGVPWPKEFSRERRREKEFLSYVRESYKLLPGYHSTLKNSATILAGSRYLWEDLPARYAEKRIYLPENGIDTRQFSSAASPAGDIMRACFVGRMVPYKGPDMLLDAAAPLLRSGRLLLDMVGDGPMLPELRQQATKLGIENAVTFHGWQAHADVPRIMANCAVFAFPSIREFGGGAVLEAMALGLGPLIVDYAGPAELVSSDSGVKFPLGTRDEIVQGFSTALERLVDGPEHVRVLGENARRRVEDYFTWDRKAEQLQQVYRWVVDGGTRPDLLPAV